MPDSISIIFIIVVFVFLGSCSSSNIYRCYNKKISHSTNSDVITHVQEKDNARHQKKTSSTDTNKYNSINHSSHQSSIYIVKSGDTLFYIAWITGNNYLDLAKMNNIKNINILKPGQILLVHQNKKLSYFKQILIKKLCFFINENNILKQIFFFKINKNTFFHSNTFNNIISCSKNSVLMSYKNCWYWPTNGTIINFFSDSERGNKGIDISGVLGQPILSAADGTVIYVGNTLKGYGNMIIIKHGNNYLSAYAHNDIVLVSEQQKVKMGDKIATMGNSGTNEVKLHFEIRYKGKSVNPLYCLKNK